MTDRSTQHPDPDREPDEGAFDPEMTDGDEGNTPPDEDDDQQPVERPL